MRLIGMIVTAAFLSGCMEIEDVVEIKEPKAPSVTLEIPTS